MTDLAIRILSVKDISPGLGHRIDALDHLAFSGSDDAGSPDPEFDSIEWSSPDWLVLGFVGSELVCQLCLLEREITAGGEQVRVAGVGGVATHPGWQRCGLASQLLRAAETFMRDKMQVPFGLLVCAEATQPVYAHCGWQTVAGSLLFVQDGRRRTLETCVMILPLAGRPWPAGEIDLLGLPW
jgi:GNAT superfamily N-acetyltransferase